MRRRRRLLVLKEGRDVNVALPRRDSVSCVADRVKKYLENAKRKITCISLFYTILFVFCLFVFLISLFFLFCKSLTLFYSSFVTTIIIKPWFLSDSQHQSEFQLHFFKLSSSVIQLFIFLFSLMTLQTNSIEKKKQQHQINIIYVLVFLLHRHLSQLQT